MCEFLLIISTLAIVYLGWSVRQLEKHVSELQDIVVKLELGGK